MLQVLSPALVLECLSKKDEILYVYPGFIRHCLPFLNPSMEISWQGLVKIF